MKTIVIVFMCWEVKVGIVVTGNLVTRACGDFSDGMYKLLFCCWKPEEVSQETNEDELLEVRRYHPVNRKESETILKHRNINGDFIIRPSSKSDNVCSLSVCQDSEVYHINVRRRSDGFLALGKSKPNENCFGNIEDIIDCYMHEKLLINSCGKRVLTLLIKNDIS